jgi:hypothetical protein
LGVDAIHFQRASGTDLTRSEITLFPFSTLLLCNLSALDLFFYSMHLMDSKE